MNEEDSIKAAKDMIEPAERGKGRILRLIFLQAAGLVTAALGLLALLGWILALPLLTSFKSGLMPMAPSTAVLFLLYGVAICLRARPPLSRRAGRISLAMVALGTLGALLLLALACLSIYWPGEHLGLNTPGTVGGAPTGHMSPVSAGCFLLASLSFLALLSRPALRSWRTALAFLSAGVLLGTCFVFLLAYIYGTPLLYGGQFVPPAINTILAFVTMSMALLALAGWPTRRFGGSPPDGFRTMLAFILIFVLLGAGIVATGYFYYRNYEQHHRTEAERTLLAIADLKVGELTQWRKERMGDGSLFFQNPVFSALLQRFLAKPEDAHVQRRLQIWIEKIQQHNDYDRVRLLDSHGVTLLSSPAVKSPASSVIMQRTSEVLRSGQMAFQDFYRNELDQRIYLAILVPIFDEVDASRPLGTLVLRIDPETYLYPLLQRWPTPSSTAETLLVRREGNQVVFLNELRFQTNVVLNRRESLDRVNLPAAQAALGREGAMEGVDYRNLPVFAALRTIPDSPWALVARMDKAEVYSPLRERLLQLILMIGVLLLGAAACVGLVWRQQRIRHYKEQAQSAEALAIRLRIANLFSTVHDDEMFDEVLKIVLDVMRSPFGVFGYIDEAGAEVVPTMTSQIWDKCQVPNKTFIFPRATWGDSSWPRAIREKMANFSNEVSTRTPAGHVTITRHISLPILFQDEAIGLFQVANKETDYTAADMRTLEDIAAQVAPLLRARLMRERAERALHVSSEELQHKNAELERFLYSASHDLKSPVVTVRTFLGYLERDMAAADADRIARDIAFIRTAANKMARLLDDLLEISRIGRLVGKPVNVALRALVDDAICVVGGRIAERGIEMHANVGALVLHCDRARLAEIYQNLIDNACKFMGDQKEPRIEIGVAEEDDKTVFFVRDNGIGIEPRHQTKVFDLFEKLDPRDEGTGIGLALVKRVVELYGGRIWVESAGLGQGACFNFTLPKAIKKESDGEES